MKSDKNILIITPGFPVDENDENCIPPLQEFLIEFPKSFPGIKFFVITLQYPFQKKKYSWRNIHVYSCRGKNKKFPFRFFSWSRALLYFYQINKKNKINVIQSFWLGETAMIGNLLSRLNKTPHINTLMGQDALQKNKFLKYINLNSLKISSLSENHNKSFFQTTKRNSDIIIPFGIKNHNVEKENQKREIDILGVGSLIPLKNFSAFIKIVNELKEDFPKINCVIIGEGIERTKLEQQREDYNLKNNLTFVGKIPRKEVFNYMKKSKVLLHLSKYESLGYVYEEALLFGMTIVSFDTGIAKKSERWFVVKNENEAISTIKELKNNFDYSSLIPYPIGETAERYFNIYENLKYLDTVS